MSDVRVESPDGSLVDDTESELSFTLPEDSYVLVIYNASSRYGSREYRLGKYGFVNVDGISLYDTRCDQAPGWDDFANSITCVWAGRLTAGAHTVRGVFAGAVAGYTVGVDVRQMVVLAVPVSSGPLAYGVVAPSTLSYYPEYPVEDPHARLLFSLAGEAGVLAVYNASKMKGWASVPRGAYAVMFVDGLPVLESRVDQSTLYTVTPTYESLGLTSVAFARLGAGVHSISCRFTNTYVTTRTLAYIVAPREWASTGRMSFVRVEGNYPTMRSPPPWDDPEAILTIDLPEDSLCLAVYSVTNSPDSVESDFGKFTLINVDGVDVPESFASQSPGRDNYGNSVLSLWAGRLTAGSHTIKGRWGSNLPDETTGIDRRVIAVICIPESLLI
jgi:hypothetical protein